MGSLALRTWGSQSFSVHLVRMIHGMRALVNEEDISETFASERPVNGQSKHYGQVSVSFANERKTQTLGH